MNCSHLTFFFGGENRIPFLKREFKAAVITLQIAIIDAALSEILQMPFFKCQIILCR